jgi:hypothetical protein
MMNEHELIEEIAYWKAKYEKVHSESKYWQDLYFKAKDHAERLCLDLGLKEQGYIE